MGIPCHVPATGEELAIEVQAPVRALLSQQLLQPLPQQQQLRTAPEAPHATAQGTCAQAAAGQAAAAPHGAAEHEPAASTSSNGSGSGSKEEGEVDMPQSAEARAGGGASTSAAISGQLIDCVLVVPAPGGRGGAEQQRQRPALPQLLPARAAAAALGVRAHRVRLRCQIRGDAAALEAAAWGDDGGGADPGGGGGGSGGGSEGADAAASAAAAIAAALQRQLNAPLAAMVQLLGGQVQVQSLVICAAVSARGLPASVDTAAAAAAAAAGGGAGQEQQQVLLQRHGVQSLLLDCSWDYGDDVFAEQCLDALRMLLL